MASEDSHNRRHEVAESNIVTTDQMKGLVSICRLSFSEDADIEAHALRKMEDSTQTTLMELCSGIQLFFDVHNCVAASNDSIESKHHSLQKPTSRRTRVDGDFVGPLDHHH